MNGKYHEFERIMAQARAAGEAAGAAAVPQPMVVGSPSSPLGNDIDPSKPVYYVADGVCGFAWVHIPDARQPFVRYLKGIGEGHKGYPKGWDIWVSFGGQSMQRKEAYAGAMARVLKDHGIDCYMQSRMD